MQVYGLFARIEMGVQKATILEGGTVFKRFANHPAFVTAGGAMGGEVLPRTAPQPSTSSSSSAPSTGNAGAVNSSNSGF